MAHKYVEYTRVEDFNCGKYPLPDGPFEAEVRDAGKTPGGEAGDDSGGLTLFLDSLTLPSVLLGLLGLASVLMLLLILLLLMFTLRRRRMPQLVPLTEASRPQSAASKESGHTPAMHTPERISTCLEEELQVTNRLNYYLSLTVAICVAV